MAGSLLAGLWLFTDHLYSYRNENLFQLNPSSLILFFMLVLTAVRVRKRERVSKNTMRWARIVAGLAVLGCVVQLLPFMNQINGDVIAFALPLHLGVLALLGSIEGRGEPAMQPA
jgi:heme/copper-type cytochrome/quinol oxidase subunit 4